MNASEFSALLHAKSLRRGRWIAKCPAHPDKRPSLSIAEGRSQPVVFKCMSQGCTQDEVLKAMGLTWKDVLGERPRRQMSQRLKDEITLQALKELVKVNAIEAMLALTGFDAEDVSDGPAAGRVWALVCSIRLRITALENKLNPDLAAIRERDAKTARFVKRWGWDRLWKIFESSPNGKAVIAEHDYSPDK